MVTEAKTVECWGDNQYGQLGPNNTTGLKSPVPGLSNVKAVAVGDSHSCAIIEADPQANGFNTVKCWGANNEGQLGNGTTDPSATPQYVKGGAVIIDPQKNIFLDAQMIVAGAAHTCVKSVTSMFCWGRNSSGQLGDSTFTAKSTSPRVVIENTSGQAIHPSLMVAGANHTCAIGTANSSSSNNFLFCWGAGLSGQLGNGSMQNFPGAVAVSTSIVHSINDYTLSAGNTHTCLRDMGQVRCWGNWGGSTTYKTPEVVTTPDAASTIVSGNNHICAIVTDKSKQIDGEVRCFGINADGQIGNGTRSAYVDATNWTTVKGLNSPALSIEAGGSQTCALLDNGSIACWGLNGLGQLGDGLRNNTVSAVATGWWKPFPTAQPGYGVQAISVGWAHTCALINNQVKCWGSNYNAQVGTPASTTPQKLPIVVNGFMPGNIVSLVSGNLHSCVLFDTGKVQCWGDNQQGQLGNDSTAQSAAPVTVNLAPTDIATSIVAAGDYTCAILKDETAKCWGSNSHGQLGAALPMGTYSKAPVAVSGLNGITQLSAKMVHTCALLRDGTTKCWGANFVGQLGNNNYTNTNVPVSNALWINDVVKLSVGSENSCVLRAIGTVWCWGRIFSDGKNIVSNYPQNIPYVNNVADISAGNGMVCARFDNGTLKCFGYDSVAMGKGKDLPSTGNTFLPNSVRYLSAPASSVALSRYMHACAILVTGEVSCWGSNYAGQLGNDSLVDSNTPVLVHF